jgi:hypothetical protein
LFGCRQTHLSLRPLHPIPLFKCRQTLGMPVRGPPYFESVWRRTFSLIKANCFLVDGGGHSIVPTRPP